MATTTNDYAFILGFNDYSEKDFVLKGAKKDATSFHEWFKTNNTGLKAQEGLNSYNCKIELSKKGEKPDIGLINRSLKLLMETAFEANAKGNRPRRLYFYFSGHGLGLSDENIGMCYPAWGSENLMANLKLNDYLEYLRNTGLFQEIITILDCCRVRDIKATGGLIPTMTFNKPTTQVPATNYLTIFSCEYLTTSTEAKIDGEVRGYFTTALLKGLEGAASIGTGTITYLSLLNYLYRQVPILSKQTQKPRHNTNILSLNTDFISLPDKKVDYKYDEDNFHYLTITKPHNDPNFQSATLYNYYNEEEWNYKQKKGRLSLAAGKYFLYSEFTDANKTEEIELNRDYNITIGMISEQVVPNHEYYCYPAEHSSKNPIRTLANANAGLLIFIRYQEAELVDKEINMNENLCLKDEKGNIITKFEKEDLFHENIDVEKTNYLNFGFLNYSIKAPNGLYFLSYTGKNKRELPVYLFKGRQTQVFLLFKTEPIFETTRIFIPEAWKGFDAYSPQGNESTEKKIDAATRFLQNAHGDIPIGLLSDLFGGKFDDPMRGVLAAYILLKGYAEKADFYNKFFEEKRPDFIENKFAYFELVVSNLTELLGADSPDVMAIKLFTTDFMDTYKGEKYEFSKPPMVNWALQEIIKRASKSSSLIPIDSMLNAIAPKVRIDAAFSCWEPLTIQVAESDSIADNATKSINSANEPLEKWIVNEIIQEVAINQKNDSASKLEYGFDKKMAEKLSLPIHTVRYYMSEMSNYNALDAKVIKRLDLDSISNENVLKTVNSFSEVLAEPTLKNIFDFDQRSLLKKENIKTINDFINLENNIDSFNRITENLKIETTTMTNWINKAKGWLE